MEIKIIQNKEEWNGWFLEKEERNNFLQSWEWGGVLIAEGKNVERLAVLGEGKILAQAQIVYVGIFFGWQYAFCPKGPVLDEQKDKHLKLKIHEAILNYLKNKNCIFFRIEPEVLPTTPHSLFIKKTIDINPAATLLLDITKTEGELLSGMHSKTRYNIHLAEKKNLQISQDKNLEVFWGLMKKTGGRDKFGLHHKNHYEKVLASPAVCQLTAYDSGKSMACAVFVRFGSVFTYLYGASDYEYRNLMAPYLLQWEGIKMGRALNCKKYDFFGVAPKISTGGSYEYDSKHQYAGVTRFKLGFGGTPHAVSGAFDLVINNNKYRVYSLLRWIRRLF